MKNVIKFLSFIVYLVILFYIKELKILLLLVLLHFSFIYVLKINFRLAIKRLAWLLPFVIFTTGINSIISGYLYGIFIGVRLLAAYTITYIFINSITTREMADTIGKLLFPLKMLQVDVESITLIIAISLSILPIMLEEIKQKKYAIESKGMHLRWNHMLILLKPIFISILNRTNELENALITKGYEEG